jgi:hypothetical protein
LISKIRSQTYKNISYKLHPAVKTFHYLGFLSFQKRLKGLKAQRLNGSTEITCLMDAFMPLRHCAIAPLFSL